ncbi:hypothetical protein SLS64_013486 [Diaporthe eres]|uniref:F-box domain-containing protein n=1 Tax=Diaporthe eres TaxID=83184 RepID=A0ABR1NQW5_DIAER
MANPQDLPSAQMAFTKYPGLPKEIRLMIIDEVIEVTRHEYWKGSPWMPAKPYLFPLASVNYEWNKVIEMLLFNRMRITPSSLSELAAICGKRHRRLNIIILSIKRTEVPSGDQPEAYVGAAVAQFFNIMKDWSHMDRERQGLLEVSLDLYSILRDHPPGTVLNCSFVDNENKSKEETEDIAHETSAALVQGLTTMLPGMPKLTTVSIELNSTVLNPRLFIRLGMRLGNPVHVDKHDWPQFYSWIQSCSYRFVPSHDSGVVLAIGTDFPGHLATELQHTVRRHQLKDLGVFFGNDELSPWGNHLIFWQWNSEEQCWDAVFEEEEDEFIYQMGEYFDSTKSM